MSIATLVVGEVGLVTVFFFYFCFLAAIWLIRPELVKASLSVLRGLFSAMVEIRTPRPRKRRRRRD